MRTLIQYQIDAFASKPFTGNPAAVIVLPDFLDDSLMQAIAMENNLSETAFLVPKSTQTGHYDLRWFTPTVEIDFCGHATIASAHALTKELRAARTDDDTYIFSTKIGTLTVGLKHGAYILTAPKTSWQETPLTEGMTAAFPMPLEIAIWAGPNLYVIAKSWTDIAGFRPDFSSIIPLSNHGVGITSRGGADGADITSRFFVPVEGIDEDPVTGSAHAALGPFWAERLGQSKLRAYQASARGGWLDLNVGNTHIQISGPAITFAKSEIYLPD